MLLATGGIALAQQDRTTPDTQRQTAQENAEDVIPGQYIVVLKDDASDPRAVARDHAQRYGAEVLHVYEFALKGYAARIPDGQLDRVRSNPRVQFIDEDREVRAFDHNPRHSGGDSSGTAEQTLPTGVDRTEGDQSSTKSGDGSGAVNVGVAVIDTGIDLKHPDLNAQNGKTCVTGTRSANDDNGHGGHVAGTLGAKDNSEGVVGVAPGATLYAVKVLNRYGSGSRSGVICGIDWVSANAQSKGIKVANMSLGGSGSDSPSDENCNNANNDSYHKAICNSVKKGVTYVVAAGNSSEDFVDTVPAAYDEVLTVTNVADFDGQPGGKHTGNKCVDDVDDTARSSSNFTTKGHPDEGHTIAAPGTCIKSTWKNGGYNTISGTSMASPHAAGMAALYLANNNLATPAQVMAKLRDDAKAQPTSYGFTDDPNSPNGSRYYGYLGYAGSY